MTKHDHHPTSKGDFMVTSRATLALAFFCVLMTQSGALRAQTISFTMNEPVTRVSVPGRDVELNPSVGPGWYLCRPDAANPPDAARLRAAGFTDWTAPETLKSALVDVLANKTSAQVGALIAQIESQPDRLAKFALMVGANQADTRHVLDGLSGPLERKWGTNFETGEEFHHPTSLRCFSGAQLDQVINEGLRVMRAVAGAQATGTGAPKPVAPGAVQQQRRQ